MGKKKAADVDKDVMEAAGFAFAAAPAPEDGRLRVEAMSVEGFTNVGKSSFALSSSELGPTAYLLMDSGGGVAEWYRAQGRTIAIKSVGVNLPRDVSPDDFGAVAEAMTPILTEFREACYAAIDAKFANVVIDTGWALHNLVSLGVNGKVKVNVYGGEGRLRAAVDSAMVSLFNLFQAAPETNLIVCNRLKKFGEEIYSVGWGQMESEAPYIVRCEYDHVKEDDPDSPKTWFVKVVKSKYRSELTGKRFRWDRLNGYGSIAKKLLPTFAADEDED